MRETHVTLPELALIAGTRALAGFGLGLLLSGRFSAEQRQAVGWTLLLIGVATTVPLAFEVLGKADGPERAPGEPSAFEAEARANDRLSRENAFART